MTNQGPQNTLESIRTALVSIDSRLADLTGELAATDERATAAQVYAESARTFANNAKRNTWIALGVAAVGILVGLGGFFYANRAKATADDIVEARTESRIVTCLQFNEQVTAFNVATLEENEQLKLALVAALESLRTPNPTPEQRERQDALVVAYRTEVDSRLASPPQLPTRDCSSAGIAAFYDQSPVTTTSG